MIALDRTRLIAGSDFPGLRTIRARGAFAPAPESGPDMVQKGL
jgi:hypothetical protein